MRSNATHSLKRRSFWKKAGRKIHVGDCALFKHTDGSPPFVGIIRRLITDKEENIILCVNWFYRPADLKLGEGALLEAAPNEVFYSFHEDEIPAASLLHPCKVAFLRKGVELPSGISSFVCRRVYDTENKCLWWLTDQNYINSCLSQQRQELEQLLDKTQAEMHGAAQRGGSPKPLNAPNGTALLNPDSDNIQSDSVSLLVKSKQREHGIHCPDSVNRESLSKRDDTAAGQHKPKHLLKSEIAKFTDKGGLMDFEGVEKLIQLMQPESAEKKVDLPSRVILVDVISSTDRFDCLGRFVHHKGLLILDEWLQEVHKGKIGDGSPKGSDKSVEEFIFALLRALDRLPVNLHALQTCNIGKSVNHLRSHKNSEIQKKARSLVDMWKKRVEAEMNIIETRSGTRRGGSWPNKPVMSEVSLVGSQRVSESSDADAKVSTSQPSALKSQPGKPSSSETNVESPESPAFTKLATPTSAGTESSDMLLVTIREEKSSSCSPSANNGQSCSSGHGKTRASCPQDAPSCTSGYVSMNKISSYSSHCRKSGNAIHESAFPSDKKEGVLGKNGLVNRKFSSGQGSPSRATPERVEDGSSVDNMNYQKLIVKLPNTGRSLDHTASGVSFEHASTTFGKSTLVPEKQEHHDRSGREKTEATQGNDVVATDMDLCHGNEELVGSDEVKMGTAGVSCDEHSGDGEIVEKLTEASKVNCSASDVTCKRGKSYETSYSSVNALIESCAKFSEDDVYASAGDDVGLNLLASVVAGEMSRSDVSLVCSSENNPPLPEDTCSGNDAKLRQSIEDGRQTEEDVKLTGVSNKQVLLPASYRSVDSKGTSPGNEKTGECNAQLDSCVIGLPQNYQPALMTPDVNSGLLGDVSTSVGATNGCKGGNETVLQSPNDRYKTSPNSSHRIYHPNMKSNCRSPSEEGRNVVCASEKTMENVVLSDATAASVKIATQINDESTSWSSSEKRMDEKKLVCKQVSSSNLVLKMEAGKDTDLRSYVGLGAKAEMADDMQTGNRIGQSEKPNIDSDSSVLLHGSENAKENIDNNEVDGSGGSAPSEKSPINVQDCIKQSDVTEEDSSDEPSSRAKFSSTSARVSEMVVKRDFDLNEVIPSDDGIHGGVERCLVTDNYSSVHMPYPLTSVNSVLTGNRANLITVAAAGKVSSCPENIFSKAELGWKGSGATSAISLAEPRKVIDVPVTASDAPVRDNCTSKLVRPLLDFDLNVEVIEDVSQNNALDSANCASTSGGLGLDLNACEESPDVGLLSFGFGRPTIPQLPPRSLISGGRFSNSERSSSTGFDLNSGPGFEEIGVESSLSNKGMQFLSTVPSARMNNMGTGNFTSWIPASSTSPAIAIPPVLPTRGEHGYPMVPGAAASQRVSSLAAAGTAVNPEIFRGPVLSSSPAVAFPSTMSFQFPGFPFESNFSVTSNTFSAASTAYVGSSGTPLCFPTIPMGPNAVVSSPYRPLMTSLPGGLNYAGPDVRWGSQVLDLTAGPRSSDSERRDETLPRALRQLPQAMGNEQLKVYQQMAGGGGGLLKRKAPDDGWDADRISFKHPSWN